MRQLLLRRALLFAVVATFATVFRFTDQLFFMGYHRDTNSHQGNFAGKGEEQALALFLQQASDGDSGKNRQGATSKRSRIAEEQEEGRQPDVLRKPRVDLNLNVHQPLRPRTRNTTTASLTTGSATKSSSRGGEGGGEGKVASRKGTATSSAAVDEHPYRNEKAGASDTYTSVTATSVLEAAFKNQTKSASTKHSLCFRRNSIAWLEGPRQGNDNDTRMDADFVRHMTLELPNLLLQGQGDQIGQFATSQSICPASSRFQNLSDTQTDGESLYHWRIRLVYLATLYHQQRFAIDEVRDRFDESRCTPEELRRGQSQYQIGPFDYECPDAKFLVVSLAGVGLGINVRGYVASLLK